MPGVRGGLETAGSLLAIPFLVLVVLVVFATCACAQREREPEAACDAAGDFSLSSSRYVCAGKIRSARARARRGCGPCDSRRLMALLIFLGPAVVAEVICCFGCRCTCPVWVGLRR